MSGRPTVISDATGSYRDGVGVQRCLCCLQPIDECYCKRPYWCTHCWTVDGTQFLPTEPRCCIACLRLGRTARFRA